jgi:hypothetical protein
VHQISGTGADRYRPGPQNGWVGHRHDSYNQMTDTIYEIY